MPRTTLCLCTAALSLVACSTDGTSSPDASTEVASPVDCTGATSQIAKAVCQASGFLDTLSATQRSTANPAMTDLVGRTRWSNLPGQARPGVKLGDLSATQQAAALALMATVLSSDGLADVQGVRAADSYLGTKSSSYSGDNYYAAVFGTPAASGNWAIVFGGHHMAFNITFVDGVAHPIPNHLGVEPKAAFTVGGQSYEPMSAEGGAMKAVFASLDGATLANAKLAGTFSDVVVGPVEYGTGSSAAAKARFPTGANRTGVLVSALSAAQQALVTAAIEQWINDYDAATAATLRAAYTSTAAYQDTYVAWGGTGTTVDVDVNGTYMRIDGPRVWIELSCQAGVVIQGATHYHSIYRDKADDYAGTL